VDFSKYVPPFLASHIGNMPVGDLSAFALPPIPDEIESYESLSSLADIRQDDLLFGGTIRSSELHQMMESVNDLVRQYAELWAGRSRTDLQLPMDESHGTSGVNEVLYGLLNERDKLIELSKLVGRLRFTVETSDIGVRAEIEQEINLLSKFLPDNYCIPDIIRAVLDSSSDGSRLAQLYVDRCYKLSDKDDVGAADIDNQIESIKASLDDRHSL